MFDNFKKEIRKIAALSDADCDLLRPKLSTRQVAKNGIILKEGQVCTELGFIHRGLFRMYYLQDGKEINTHFFFENSFLTNYQSFLLQQPSRYYLQALADSELITFPFQDLQLAYRESANWERFGRKVAEFSYLLATQRAEAFLFMNAEQRYLALMENEPWVIERVPLYHIASFLGIERESLSRLRKKISAP